MNVYSFDWVLVGAGVRDLRDFDGVEEDFVGGVEFGGFIFGSAG